MADPFAAAVEEGKHCNRKRADILAKAILADDPVYKSQYSALYRLRCLEMFPDTRKFLKDPGDKEYSVQIDKIATVMKQKLKATPRLEERPTPTTRWTWPKPRVILISWESGPSKRDCTGHFA